MRYEPNFLNKWLSNQVFYLQIPLVACFWWLRHLMIYFVLFMCTVGLVLSRRGREGKDNEIKINLEEKMVIGSRPPGCQNKCMSCRPCMAAVVVPVHRMKGKAFQAFFTSREEEDSYYLLSWKCRCGNKIYQP